MYQTVTRPVWVEIDLDKIKKNFKNIKENISREILITPVVKANAYGHGMDQVSKALDEAGADRFAVALPEEGEYLRKAGINKPIHILGEVLPQQIKLLVDFNLIPTISKIETAEKLNDMVKEKKIHIKIDTGMGRLGVLPENTLKFFKKINKLSNLKIEGVLTHFSKADEENKEYTFKQWKIFKDTINLLQENGFDIPLKHAANSATIMDLPSEMLMNMVRPGIIIYGLSPSQNQDISKYEIEPVLNWKAKIVYLKEVKEDTAISYGGTYITNKKTKVATIPLGYADGYSRLLSNKAEVLIHGKRVPVIGRVCMDQFMVDVTDLNNVKTGDEVILIGEQGNESISADEIANIMGTINYEVVCNISDRIPRTYKNS